MFKKVEKVGIDNYRETNRANHPWKKTGGHLLVVYPSVAVANNY